MGNVMCASRLRAPLLSLSLDLLSFPFLLESANVSIRDEQPSQTRTHPPDAASSVRVAAATSGRSEHGSIAAGAKHSVRPGGAGLGAAYGRTELVRGGDGGGERKMALLTRKQSKAVFLQWQPFCAPWPACLLSPP